MPYEPSAKDESAKELLRKALLLDSQSREAEAIKFYRNAIKAGLTQEDLRDALVCLASSYRNVGSIRSAQSIIKKAYKLFPHDPVVIVFYALIQYTAGKYEESIKVLSNFIISKNMSELRGYESPLRRYIKSL